MESSKVGYWLQVGGNIGILLGLVVVALQLYQDRQLKAAEMVMAQLDNAIQIRLALMGEEPHKALLKSIEDPDGLSREEALILSQVYEADLTLYDQQFYMIESGIWEEFDVLIPRTMTTPAGYRFAEAIMPTVNLLDSTKEKWSEEFRVKRYGDMLSSMVDGIRDDASADSLREKIIELGISLEHIETDNAP